MTPTPYKPEPERWVVKCAESIANAVGMPTLAPKIADLIQIDKDRDENAATLQDLTAQIAALKSQ